MPFNRPSLDTIEADLIAQIDGSLDATDARVRRSVLGVLSRTFAGSLHMLYGFLEWSTRQAFPWSAEAEYLEQWGAIWGITRAAAVKATGSATISGTAGTTLPAATVLRAGDRQEYTTDTEVTVGADGTAGVAVTARTGGAAGNAAMAAKLSLASPVAGIQSSAVTATALTGGADQENDASLRRRLVERVQAPPRGGTGDDYVQWALSGHNAVTRAWARPLASGLGTVTVYLMTDDAGGNGTPAAAVVTAVQDYIDARRPVTAAVTVAAPSAQAMNVGITSVTPNTAAVRAAIEAELRDLIRRDSAPGGTILISHIREAISTAAGETDHTLTAPAGDVAHAEDEIAVLGTVSFRSG